MLNTKHPFCVYKSANIQELKRLFPTIDGVLQEGQWKDLQDELFYAEEVSYNWTLLSNAHHPISFFGTYKQLLSQRFDFIPLVKGQCDAFSVHSADLELLTTAQTFFSAHCVQRNSKASALTEYRKESHAAMWFGGALLLGGLTYLLKDKRITIDVLSF